MEEIAVMVPPPSHTTPPGRALLDLRETVSLGPTTGREPEWLERILDLVELARAECAAESLAREAAHDALLDASPHRICRVEYVRQRERDLLLELSHITRLVMTASASTVPARTRASISVRERLDEWLNRRTALERDFAQLESDRISP